MRPPMGRGRGGAGGGAGRFGGGGRGGGGRFGGGRGGGGYDQGPPEQVVEAGQFAHACEGEAVCKLTNEKVRRGLLAPRAPPALCAVGGPAIARRRVRCWLAMTQIPYFNAPIFLENKTQVGKVEEILGPINNVVRGERRGKARARHRAAGRPRRPWRHAGRPRRAPLLPHHINA